VQTREIFTASLKDLGWEVLPSKANFVFARRPGLEGEAVYERLKEKGILVRHFRKGKIKDFVRITIGTDDEMAVLLDAAKGL